MTDQAQFDAAFSAGRDALRKIPSYIGALMDGQRHKPAAGSIASIQLDECADPEALRTAFSQAELSLLAASDHAFGLERSLRPEVMSFAPWTISRGVLEAASITRWLSAPDVDVQTRVARSMSLRRESVRQELAFLRNAPNKEALGGATAESHLEGRLALMEDQASVRGVETRKGKKGRAGGFGDGVPSATDLAEVAFGDGWVYRLQSGVAHGHYWALNSVGLERIDGQAAVRQSMSPVVASFLVFRPIDWIVRATWDLFELYDWSTDQLVTVLESEYDAARFKDSVRFWRGTAAYDDG